MTRSYTTASTQNSPRTWRYTAVGGETTLSGVDGFSVTLSYAVGGEQLFVNGVLLERGVDYTAANGTSVTLSNALVVGDLVTINSQNTFAIANAIPLSTVTAKGDTIVATGSGSVTNLGVGADGTTLVANSSAGGGVSWTGNQAAGKNTLINGVMDIWQRGTSFSISAGVPQYTADRWTNYFNAAGTVTQDTSLVQAGQKYGLRVTASANSVGNTMYQVVETFNTLPLAGQTVTLSAWVAGTSGKSPTIGIDYSTNTDDIFLGTYTTLTGTAIKSVTTSGSFQQIVYTFSIPSTAKTLRIALYANGMNNGDYITWSRAQLELGAAATTFSRAGGTLQGELAACQRYYTRYTAAGSSGSILAFAPAVSTTNWFFTIPTPVPMRTTALVLDGGSSGLQVQTYGVNSYSSGTWSASYYGNSNAVGVTYGKGGSDSAWSQGQIGNITNTSSGAYLGFSAEL